MNKLMILENNYETTEILNIKKRDGRTVEFKLNKIADAIYNAAKKVGGNDYGAALILAKEVTLHLKELGIKTPNVEKIQDVVEKVLIKNGHSRTAKEYILYRAERTKQREINTELMKIFTKLITDDAKKSDIKRENANIDGDTAMGTMLKFGSESAKKFYRIFILEPEHAEAHRNGDIHIHDLDFYPLTTTCCQIDIKKLLKKGFGTGHGFLREPNDILSYSALTCIAIQANQNDQHGGQSIPNFDYGLADGVLKTYRKLYIKNLSKSLELLCDDSNILKVKKELMQNNYSEKNRTRTNFETKFFENKNLFHILAKNIVGEIEEENGLFPKLENQEEYIKAERQKLLNFCNDDLVQKIQNFCKKRTFEETDKATYQAMEALVHNLNTMHSRAGAQVPFSSINYGTDFSLEGRMVIKNILLATESGLGNGETPIFPIHIFKVKEGINYNKDDPNYDLFKLACRVSAKRLFPNFSFLDAPFNLSYYKSGFPETEVSYMGCRTRALANNYDKTREITYGRGNLSFTTINLPRIAINSHGDLDIFFENLKRKIELCVEQLLHRYSIQSSKKIKNFPFLMGQGIWIDSEKLRVDDEIGEILKHGTLSVGFIGLGECLKSLTGYHHGESQISQNLGLEIIGFMRRQMDLKSEEYNMNFSLLATPAEGLSGRFVKIDKEKYGIIPEITDREYYTNSFHVPVYYDIDIFEKIKIEAPYHALTNAGHISYVEVDGDPSKNLEAFEQIIRFMKESGIGYGSINHPVDRDPKCGYTGIIDNICPGCNRNVEEDKKFNIERIRRITGYLVGTLDRFNDAKKAETKDRLKHIKFEE
ncbi:MAG: anaerobic ribonucleoside triphosphate reductase [Clostridiales bacterium]|jgi:ribonucleoside-triphosphate reductase|nr:anaerobic ribonucleoside triphosphate reductase [Clostridiales bacterium]